MAAPAERIDGLKLVVAKAVRVAGSRAVSLNWVEGRGGFHYSLRSLARVRFRFSFFLGFFMGVGAVSGDCVGITGCGVETTGGTAVEGFA